LNVVGLEADLAKSMVLSMKNLKLLQPMPVFCAGKVV